MLLCCSVVQVDGVDELRAVISEKFVPGARVEVAFANLTNQARGEHAAPSGLAPRGVT